MKSYIDILAALLTPTIALITTYIAIQQYRTNKLKRRLELYDRRMAIYISAAEYISTVINIDPARREDAAPRATFYGHAYESYFLFDKEIYNYLAIIRLRGLQVDTGHVLLTKYSQQRSREEIEKEKQDLEENEKWLSEQFRELQKKFTPYLKLAAMK